MSLPNIVIMHCPPRDCDSLTNKLHEQGAEVVVVSDVDKRGALPNAIACFQVALELGGPVTILQDDVEVCHNFVPYIAQYFGEIERRGHIVQWFCNGGMFNGEWSHDHVQMLPRSPDRFLSTQAVTYPRGVAAHLLQHLRDAFRHHPTPLPGDSPQIHGDDQHIQHALLEMGRGFYIHVPNLVQHVGEQSLVGPGITLYDGFRQSKCYVGRGFNAVLLPLSEPWNYDQVQAAKAAQRERQNKGD